MPNSSIDVISELERLAALHKGGVLTDDEFAGQKFKLLNAPAAVAPAPAAKTTSAAKRVVRWTVVAVIAFLVFAYVNAEYPELFLAGLPKCDSPEARKMVERTVEENSVGLARAHRIIRWIADRSTDTATSEAVRCRAQVSLNVGGETGMVYAFTKSDDTILINVEFEGGSMW